MILPLFDAEAIPAFARKYPWSCEEFETTGGFLGFSGFRGARMESGPGRRSPTGSSRTNPQWSTSPLRWRNRLLARNDRFLVEAGRDLEGGAPKVSFGLVAAF